jgi:DNA-binding NarL/FixJ family response regulator
LKCLEKHPWTVGENRIHYSSRTQAVKGIRMRVVIADDEYLARASLRSMLEELTLPLDFVGEAANGEEMIALVGQHLPDVAFVDIRMPRLNGLEAIRTARLISPQTRWLILTGFPEFDYAREAIRLDVSDYLLKPVNPEELRRVLGDFIEENRRLKIARNKQFERELMALAYGLTSLEYEEPTSLLVKSYFSGALLYIDSHVSEKIKAQRQLKLCHALLDVIDRIWITTTGSRSSFCPAVIWPSLEPGSLSKAHRPNSASGSVSKLSNTKYKMRVTTIGRSPCSFHRIVSPIRTGKTSWRSCSDRLRCGLLSESESAYRSLCSTKWLTSRGGWTSASWS